MKTDKSNLLLNIRRKMPDLNPALKRIAKYVTKNPEKVKLLKIKELASKCEVSEGTVTRFVKEFKINTYQELKIILAEMTVRDRIHDDGEEKFFYDDVRKGDSVESVIEKVAFLKLEAIGETKKIINPIQIEKAVSAIAKSTIIFVYCVGTSSIAAESAKMRFYRVGIECIVYNDPAHQAVSSALMNKNSVAIGISDSGKSAATVNALKIAKESGATTICITSSELSPINNFADIRLYSAPKTSTFFNESLASRVSQIYIIDILYACYALKHYNKSINMLEKSSDALVKLLHY